MEISKSSLVQLYLRYPINSFEINSNSSASLIFEMAPSELKTIEKLREAKDLQLKICGYLLTEFQNNPQIKNNSYFELTFRIPKSDWVESYLPALGFKTVSLIEVPQLLDADFAETIGHVDDAWKQYSMGEYHRVFTDCRKAKESLSEKIKSKGFEKEETIEGKKVMVPDWDKFFENEELGDAIAVISKKLSRITSIGAHPGRLICKEDADFALMTTHAMVNLVVRKFNQSNN